MQCPDCSYPNPPEANFCQNCGVNLKQTCPVCGANNPPTANFCINCGASLATAARRETSLFLTRHEQLAAATPPALVEKMRAAANLAGERRVVTALFADVVDSTAIAERMDPEEWTGIMNRLFSSITPVIYKYEGTIARLMGDALLAFFGAPVAHEDDPERAVLAALDLLHAATHYAAEIRRIYGFEFSMRVGLNTGAVVVGDVGSNLIYEYTAMGDAINLAARLQSLARPMTVLISENTYRFVKPLFEVADKGEMQVKGKTRPVHVYEVLHPRLERGKQRGIDGVVTPLVGRDPELKQLLQISRKTQAGVGQAVVIIGEAGMGKTRLLAEWHQAVERESPHSFRWITGGCLSYGHGLAYHLIIDLLRSITGVHEGTGIDGWRTALQSLCQGLFDHPEPPLYPALAHLLAIPLDERDQERVSGLDPQGLQEAYSAALRGLVGGLVSQQPLIILLEDLHWADPSSVELLLHLLPLAPQAPLMVCGTFRSEPNSPGWRLLHHARQKMGSTLSEIVLSNLSDQESTELIGHILNTSELPPAMQNLVVRKVEGNPFFVEESMRMLIESGYLVYEDGHWRMDKARSEMVIPDTLQGLLLARIDRLPEEARRILRVASVIGRQFPVPVLEKLNGKNDDQGNLMQLLSMLENRNLLRMEKSVPHFEYSFRHALMQDAAYQSLLNHDKRSLHRAVGAALEEEHAPNLDSVAALIAHHYYEAGEMADALNFYCRAGAIALKQYAINEALEIYNRAIEIAWEIGPVTAEIYQARAEAHETIGNFEAARRDLEQALSLSREVKNWRTEWQSLLSLGMLWASRSYAETGRYFQQALDLARQVGEKEQIAYSLNRLGNWYANIDEPDQGKTYHLEALQTFQTLNSTCGLAETHDLLGLCHLLGADIHTMRYHFNQAIELFEQLDDRKGLASVLSNMVALSPGFESDCVSGATAPLSETLRLCQRALEITRSISYRSGEAYALSTVGACQEAMGDFGAALENAHKAHAIAGEIRHREWLTSSSALLGALYMDIFDYEPAENYLKKSLYLAHKSGSINWVRMVSGKYARLLLYSGKIEEAGVCLSDALDEDAPASTLGQRSVWVGRAELAIAMKEPDLALDICQRLERDSVEKDPAQNPVRLRLLLGEVYMLQGRWQAGERELRIGCQEARTQGIRPLEYNCQMRLAQLFEINGQVQQAVERYNNCRSLIYSMAETLQDERLKKNYIERAYALVERSLV